MRPLSEVKQQALSLLYLYYALDYASLAPYLWLFSLCSRCGYPLSTPELFLTRTTVPADAVCIHCIRKWLNLVEETQEKERQEREAQRERQEREREYRRNEKFYQRLFSKEIK